LRKKGCAREGKKGVAGGDRPSRKGWEKRTFRENRAGAVLKERKTCRGEEIKRLEQFKGKRTAGPVHGRKARLGCRLQLAEPKEERWLVLLKKGEPPCQRAQGSELLIS